MVLHNRKKTNLTSFFLFKRFVFTINLIILDFGKTRRLNFVLFSGHENSETKLRNETNLSETKFSEDSTCKIML